MQRKQDNSLPFSYRVIALALFALCLLLLLWVAGHVHPDFATASSPTQGAPGTAAASAFRHVPHSRGGSLRPL